MADDPKKQIQALQDSLQLALNQRNNAHNEGIQMGIEIMALRREIEELKKAATESLDVAKVALAVAKNGHAEAAAQA